MLDCVNVSNKTILTPHAKYEDASYMYDDVYNSLSLQNPALPRANHDPTTIPWRHHFPSVTQFFIQDFDYIQDLGYDVHFVPGVCKSLQSKLMSARTNPLSLTFTSKGICRYYYQLADNDKEWRCRKCMQLESKNGGWTNLLSHLKSCVGMDYVDQYMSHAASIQSEQIAAGNGTSVGSTG